MNVLALNGSLRGKRGATHKILQSIGKGVKKAGGLWDIINISEISIESCTACNYCQKGKTYKCIFHDKDNAQDVFTKMMRADILIYASPVYVFGVSSLLKFLLERIYSQAPVDEILLTKSGLFFHAINKSIASKPFVSIVVCDNIENLTVSNTKQYFNVFGRFMDAPHVAHIERRSAATWIAALNGTNKRMKEYAENVLFAYVHAGEELVEKGRISRGIKRKAERRFIKIPFLVRMARHIPPFRPFIRKGVLKRSGNLRNRLHIIR